MTYDIIIIGGGPAGVASAVYAARKRMRALLITESIGGQSEVSADIENWIGTPHISGFDLAKTFEAHVKAYPDMVEIKTPERVVSVQSVKCIGDGEERVCDFEVSTDKGVSYYGKTVMLAAGARRRKLGVPGEDTFAGRGVAYCSTCDAPLFSGKKVAVIGGGNAGLEAVEDLFPYAAEVYLVEYGEVLKGDAVTQEHVKANPKLKGILLNSQTMEIIGEKFVTGLKYKDKKTGEEKVLPVDGVFVEIGSIPNSEIVKNLIQIDTYGQVIIDSKHGTTSQPGVFAAGDITDDPYKQNNISAGDAVKATLAAYAYLLRREKTSPAVEGKERVNGGAPQT